jgi:hypothetical protein
MDHVCKGPFISNSCGAAKIQRLVNQMRSCPGVVDHLWKRSSFKGPRALCYSEKEEHHWQHSNRDREAMFAVRGRAIVQHHDFPAFLPTSSSSIYSEYEQWLDEGAS